MSLGDKIAAKVSPGIHLSPVHALYLRLAEVLISTKCRGLVVLSMTHFTHCGVHTVLIHTMLIRLLYFPKLPENRHPAT